MNGNKVVRLTVGAECDTSVDVWKFFVQGDEFYFGCRNTLQKIKVSLHKGGVWKIENGKNRFYLNNRIHYSEEWDLGPFLIFPKIPVDRLELRGDHLQKIKGRINLKLSDFWQARIIQVMFSHLKGLKKVSLDVKEEIDWEWTQELRNIGTVALVSYLRRLEDREIAYVLDCKKKLAIKYKDKIPSKGVYSNMVICESYEQERPSNLISIPLGRENMYLEGA